MQKWRPEFATELENWPTIRLGPGLHRHRPRHIKPLEQSANTGRGNGRDRITHRASKSVAAFRRLGNMARPTVCSSHPRSPFHGCSTANGHGRARHDAWISGCRVGARQDAWNAIRDAGGPGPWQRHHANFGHALPLLQPRPLIITPPRRPKGATSAYTLTGRQGREAKLNAGRFGSLVLHLWKSPRSRTNSPQAKGLN